MKRYQVYLNPNSVQVLDDLGEKTDISRSAIIRMGINILAKNIINNLPTNQAPEGPLDEIIGIIKTPRKGKATSSGRVDDIYYDK